jgi:hydrogenase-4 component F
LLLQVRDYKRMFAFSTVEHMGIILTSVGLGVSVAGYGTVMQIVSHAVTKSFCFFAAGITLMAMGTREIASVRGLIHKYPAASVALVFGGLAITGAPPLAVFLSEFSILKAGLVQKEYLATGLLALFIVIAFFGIMLHVNRMVFGTATNHVAPEHVERFHLPLSCRLALIVAAVPVLVLGLYIPQPLQNLLTQAAVALNR